MRPHEFDPENPSHLSALRKLAEQAARAGGDVARRLFRTEFTIRRKTDGSEVTDADEAAQVAVVKVIQEQRDHDAIIAEEVLDSTQASPAAGNENLCWVIDPIDGTRNYVRGVPYYAVSVAVMYGGFTLAGAIHEVERDVMYSASRTEGLLLNGQPRQKMQWENVIAGRACKPLAGIPSSLQGAAYEVVRQWASRVVVRNLGSTAMHLAMVAAGHFQAALISDSRLWDIAAGGLMIDLSGGVMTTLDGRPIFPFDVSTYAGEAIPSLAASDAELHARLLPAK
ncbi:MAG: inositol monophosphatase [Planctomycetota bacterium]